MLISELTFLDRYLRTFPFRQVFAGCLVRQVVKTCLKGKVRACLSRKVSSLINPSYFPSMEAWTCLTRHPQYSQHPVHTTSVHTCWVFMLHFYTALAFLSATWHLSSRNLWKFQKCWQHKCHPPATRLPPSCHLNAIHRPAACQRPCGAPGGPTCVRSTFTERTC